MDFGAPSQVVAFWRNGVAGLFEGDGGKTTSQALTTEAGSAVLVEPFSSQNRPKSRLGACPKVYRVSILRGSCLGSAGTPQSSCLKDLSGKKLPWKIEV